MYKLLASFFSAIAAVTALANAQDLFTVFVQPPADTRPMVRWWWFGPNVTDAEIVREIRAMKAGGFGGFEIATVYPLRLEGNVPFLSDAHLKAIRLANETGRAEGMRVDITLGSGWPFGGPHISPDLAASSVKLIQNPIKPRQTVIDLPKAGPGERVVGVFVGKDMASAHPVKPANNQVHVQALEAGKTVFIVLQTPTRQQVKRPAVGAEGNVMDHANAVAVQTHLKAVGEKLLSAFGDHSPYSIFSDSLEVYGADWTPDLLTEFRKRRGYDLAPHLLQMFDDEPQSGAVRRDWGVTLSELTEERYLSPITAWAHAHATKFRSQTYGTPPVRLSSSRLVDLPEGEGAHWRGFSTTRWASAANHIYGNAVTSAESWTWLHDGAFQATPLDVKVEADVLLLEGVNQFIAHGWPYSPADVAEPGWAFYAAAVFNDHNPWWGVAADVNLYLQRMSYLLRQGQPVADVAIFLPEDDALASIKAGEATITDKMPDYVTDRLVGQILDAGYGFDFVDGQTVLEKGLSAKVLILPKMRRVAPEVMKKIASFAASGGVVLAIDRVPDLSPGFLHADAVTKQVRKIAARLFVENRGASRVVAENDVAKALRSVADPDVDGLTPEIGFVHRKLGDGDLYFVANTGNSTVSTKLRFRASSQTAQWWDARTGQAHAWHGEDVTLAPYESRVFVFGKIADGVVAEDGKGQAAHGKVGERKLDNGWTIAFDRTSPQKLQSFGSWTDLPGRQNLSGVVSYSCVFSLSDREIASGLTMLDFGPGQPVAAPSGRQRGTRALLAPALREAAEVYVNGKRAGAVWTAPFELSLKNFVKPGENKLEIRVGNTAVNELAGRTPTDYSALNRKFGERFQPQNMTGLKPLPSGLLVAPILKLAQ